MTFTVVVTRQPEGSWYMTIVEPNAKPVTNPVVAPMVATDGIELVHVPPGTLLVNVPVPLRQISGEPVMGPGD